MKYPTFRSPVFLLRLSKYRMVSSWKQPEGTFMAKKLVYGDREFLLSDGEDTAAGIAMRFRQGLRDGTFVDFELQNGEIVHFLATPGVPIFFTESPTYDPTETVG